MTRKEAIEVLEIILEEYRDGKVFAPRLPALEMAIEALKQPEDKKAGELKPCPFCGAKVRMTYNSAENAFSIWHEGTACVLEEPIKIDGAFVKSLAEAAEAWNRRVGK